jgi:hypothetical protein
MERDAVVDSKTSAGPWAFLCKACFLVYNLSGYTKWMAGQKKEVGSYSTLEKGNENLQS